MASFPVKSKRVTASIQGVPTEVVLSGYDDSILVIVTQIGKMGTLLHARKEEVYGGAPTFNIQILMGKRDEPLLPACARQIIEHISNSGGSRPLVLSLGLKDHSPETLKSIVQLVIAKKYGRTPRGTWFGYANQLVLIGLLTRTIVCTVKLRSQDSSFSNQAVSAR